MRLHHSYCFIPLLAAMFCTISSLMSPFFARSSSVSSGKTFLTKSRISSLSFHGTLFRSCASSDHDKGNDATAASTVVLDPLVVCGPSGVGKGTIIREFMDHWNGSDQFQFTVSHTTRAPRPGEISGRDYHFVSLLEMQQLLTDNTFMESAQVHGNWYGTSWTSMQDVQETGKRCLLDIDAQGVRRIKALQQSPILASTQESTLSYQLRPRYIFIAPPSIDVLKERLIGRNTESSESLQRRTENAVAEVEYGLGQGTFDAIVTNDDLEAAVSDFARAVEQLYQKW